MSAMEVDGDTSSMVSSKSYKVLSPIDHILHRSDMYTGSLEQKQIQRYILKENSVVEVNATCSEGFLKIVDEVISNAQDYAAIDSSVTSIKCDVNKETGWITVSNNGHSTVSTKKFENTERTIAETVFGVLHSSSNYDDTQKRTWLGKNGVGVKLTNVFSKEFVAKLCDPDTKETHTVKWIKNMKERLPTKVKSYELKTAKTEVSFLPDYARFSMSLPLDDGVVSLIEGRMQDLAMVTNKKLKVKFNDVELKYTDAMSYSKMLGGTLLSHDVVNGDDSSKLETFLIMDCEKAHISSFVNGGRCTGTAVNMVVNAITEVFSKKYPSATRLSSIIRDNLSLVILATVINPNFTSQTKEVLSTAPSKLGFEYKVSPTLAKKLLSSSIVKIIEQSIEKKEDKGAAKAIRNKTGAITDYEKATKLGGKNACTLWICEGKSAKALVVSGFSVIGREYNGVYPLRGKPLNVHDKSLKETLANKEWLDLIHILNLDPTKTYDSALVSKLPYKHLAIVTDQDDDGSHILGLVLTFFQRFFGSLIKTHPGFLQRFVTPIVKAKETPKSPFIHFFSNQAFKQWSRTHRVSEANYYKGLGTSSAQEAKEYFGASKKHSVNIIFKNEECHNILSESFGDAHADKRKEMIKNIDFDSYVDYAKDKVDVADFCKHELVHFSYANVVRTIPGIDGLKPGQRKTLFTLFCDNSFIKYKVAELAAKVTGHAKFHHGEASLQETITLMTQQYCGANQIRYLAALSQSGTRHDDRKTHAQPRYMNTKLEKITRMIFVPHEDEVLEYLEEDGKMVEPRCYAGTIPMVLINGANGIGTGYRTEIPTYGIMDVLDRCLLATDGKTSEFPLEPNTFGFKGTIKKEEGFVVYRGIASTDPFNWKEGSRSGPIIRITELPPQTWTNNVKEALEKYDWVQEVVTYTKDDNVDLRVHIVDENCMETAYKQIEKLITKKISTRNMNMFNQHGVLKNYASPEEIIADHTIFKLEVCQKRLDTLINNKTKELQDAIAKHKYIQLVLEGTIRIMGVKRDDLKLQISNQGLGTHTTELLKMLMTSLTEEESEKLKKKYEDLTKEIEVLKGKQPSDLWREDLLVLRKELESTMFQSSKRQVVDLTEDDVGEKKQKTVGNEFSFPSGMA